MCLGAIQQAPSVGFGGVGEKRGGDSVEFLQVLLRLRSKKITTCLCGPWLREDPPPQLCLAPHFAHHPPPLCPYLTLAHASPSFVALFRFTSSVKPSVAEIAWTFAGLDSRLALGFSGCFLPLLVSVLPGGADLALGLGAARRGSVEHREGMAPRAADVGRQWVRRKGGCGERGSPGVCGRFYKQREQLTK